MHYIDQIYDSYKGNISLYAPYTDKQNKNIPEELYSILSISNSILETMHLPATGETIEISWIVYSHEMMIEWTDFYATNYNIEGVVFSDDDDNVYIIKPDNTITCYNTIENIETKIADSLFDFFQ